jgi:histidinol-phosphatase (PHP family)
VPDQAPITPLPPDYHTHNLLCKHAQGLPRDYAAAARERGLGEVAATDHCPTDDGFGVEHRMKVDQFPTYCGWVEEARRMNGTRVLFGVEADYYPGCEGFLAPWLERHEFDIVLGSVHFLDYWSGDPATRGLGRNPDPALVWRIYFEHVGRMAATGLYDVAAHLDLPKRFGNPIARDLLREFALPALDRIAGAGMCIEINTSGLLHGPENYTSPSSRHADDVRDPYRKSPRECYPSADMLAWACERGIGLTFGSDAHSPARVADGFEHAVQLARGAGFAHFTRLERRRKTFVPLP